MSNTSSLPDIRKPAQETGGRNTLSQLSMNQAKHLNSEKKLYHNYYGNIKSDSLYTGKSSLRVKKKGGSQEPNLRFSGFNTSNNFRPLAADTNDRFNPYTMAD